MCHGRLLRIAATTVFLAAIAVVSCETPAVEGLTLASTSASPLPSAPQLPSAPKLPDTSQLPSTLTTLPNSAPLPTVLAPSGATEQLSTALHTSGGPKALARSGVPRQPSTAPAGDPLPLGSRSSWDSNALTPSGEGRLGRQGDHQRRIAKVHRLRALLSRLRGCLSRLRGVERRVLVLRAGTNGRRPRSRRWIARHLKISLGKEHRIERRAVQRLRLLARNTGCASGGSHPGAGLPGGIIGNFGGPLTAGFAQLHTPGKKTGRDSTGSPSDRLLPTVEPPSPNFPGPASSGPGTGFTVLIVVLVILFSVLVGGAAFVRESRRSL
jgi:hypothetical protein